MFSIPPAKTILASPSRMAWAAEIMAFKPEPHTSLTVTAVLAWFSPAPSPTWRAGFCPRPACKTFPKMTVSICSGERFAFWMAAFATVVPNSIAEVVVNCPPNLPIAVRVALTMTISFPFIFPFLSSLYLLFRFYFIRFRIRNLSI